MSFWFSFCLQLLVVYIALFSLNVLTTVIVPLLLPTLFGKRGIFTRSPLLWVFQTFSFYCYRVYLPCFILLTLQQENMG